MPRDLDDSLLTRYLLGVCSDEEKVRVEEGYFADDATFDRLCCLEDALIEERLDGSLGPEERASFDRRHSDGRSRERLLVTAALRTAAREQRPEPRWRTGSLVPPRWLAAAAVILLAAAGGVLVWQNAQLRRSLDRARLEQQGLQQQHDADGRRIAELELRRLDAARPAAEPPRASPPPAMIATFVLRPGLLRGPGGPQPITIASSVTSLRLQLEIDDGLDYTDYRVELRTAAGDVRWTAEKLTRSRDGATVTATIPADAVRQGEHEVVLQGRAADGTYEEAAHYYFDVARR